MTQKRRDRSGEVNVNMPKARTTAVDTQSQSASPSSAASPSKSAPGGQRPSRLARSSAILASGTLISRLIGLVKFMVAASVMGLTASRLADAYTFANTAPNQIYELVLGGILTSVLVPLVVDELSNKDHDTAWKEISTLFWGTLALAAIASVLMAILAPYIVDLTASGLPDAAHSLAVNLMRMFAAQIFFYAMTAVSGAILNAHHRFAMQAYAPVLNNLVVIGVFILFGYMLTSGPTVDLSPGLAALLGWGTTAGIAAMGLVHIPALMRLHGNLRPRLTLRSPIIAKLLRLSMWIIAYVTTNQLGLLVVQRLSSTTKGAYSAWSYAFMFFQLPNGIIAVSVMTALLPGLAQQVSKKNMQRFRELLREGIGLTALLVIPAVLGYVLLAEPIITLFLQRGNFHHADTLVVAGVLRYMAIGLVPFTMFMLILRSFYALKDTRTPFWINAIATAFAISFDYAIFAHMGVNGLALGFGLSYVLASILGWIMLSKRVGSIGGKRLLRDFAHIALACAPLALVLVLYRIFLSETLRQVSSILDVACGVTIGAVVFLVVAFAIKAPYFGQLRTILRSGGRGRGKGSDHDSDTDYPIGNEVESASASSVPSQISEL